MIWPKAVVGSAGESRPSLSLGCRELAPAHSETLFWTFTVHGERTVSLASSLVGWQRYLALVIYASFDAIVSMTLPRQNRKADSWDSTRAAYSSSLRWLKICLWHICLTAVFGRLSWSVVGGFLFTESVLANIVPYLFGNIRCQFNLVSLTVVPGLVTSRAYNTVSVC